mmetsp:Transcript_22073/g.71198  ORF Transcript_22073/g.71198 Transcript_22073/m.71198 type:complete len:239 (+) Transcript_22073:1445-2161(+)
MPPSSQRMAYRHMSERCTFVSSASYTCSRRASLDIRAIRMISIRACMLSAVRTRKPSRTQESRHCACCGDSLRLFAVWCSTGSQSLAPRAVASGGGTLEVPTGRVGVLSRLCACVYSSFAERAAEGANSLKAADRGSSTSTGTLGGGVSLNTEDSVLPRCARNSIRSRQSSLGSCTMRSESDNRIASTGMPEHMLLLRCPPAPQLDPTPVPVSPFSMSKSPAGSPMTVQGCLTWPTSG